ncbi:MAG: tail fiber domain-containing protein [Pseudomonadota bacterium]
MPDVNNPALATANATQTRAAGSRMLGYYMVGLVQVDCVFDTANFLTKDSGGNYLVDGASGFSVQLRNTGDENRGGKITVTGTGGGTFDVGTTSSVYALTFSIDGVERARLSAEGRFGIGTSSPSYKLQAMDPSALVVGVFRDYDVVAGGAAGIFIDIGARAGSAPTVAARLFAVLADANEGSLTISTRTAGSMVDRLVFETTGTVRPGSDNSQSLGSASYRWSVAYAGTGTINTSDARDKSWRGAPTEAELRAARRIAAELGFYQWNDAIAAKGADGARMHFGVRAQAVWAIMADEGLIEPLAEGADPGSAYAFLCWDKWDAVEPVAATDEVRDGEGNLIAPARAAQAGRPAGSRFGVRVDQLALFLIAAQEARIAALEAA